MNEENKELLEDLGKYKALDSLRDSDGGKLVIETLRKSIASEVSALVFGYKEMPEMELRARLAKVSAYVPLVQTLLRAKTNKEDLEKELEQSLTTLTE